MIDQSHNVEGKIDAMIQSVMNIQTAYAKALLVDEDAARRGAARGRRARRAPDPARGVRDRRAPAARAAARASSASRPTRSRRSAQEATRSGSRASAARRASRARTSAAVSARCGIALFVTCIGDAVSPEVGERDRPGARAARARGRLPRRADVLRPDAPEQRLPRRGARARAAVRRSSSDYEAVVSPSSSCVGTVRELYPSCSAIAQPACRPRVFELSELLVEQARRRRMSARRSRTASPTTRRATRSA